MEMINSPIRLTFGVYLEPPEVGAGTVGGKAVRPYCVKVTSETARQPRKRKNHAQSGPAGLESRPEPEPGRILARLRRQFGRSPTTPPPAFSGDATAGICRESRGSCGSIAVSGMEASEVLAWRRLGKCGVFFFFGNLRSLYCPCLSLTAFPMMDAFLSPPGLCHEEWVLF